MSSISLPPISHPDRPASILAAHARLKNLQSRASFGDTALRLGISEAEVLQAHSGPCVVPISMTHEVLLHALQQPGQWLMQVGDSHGCMQIVDSMHSFEPSAQRVTCAGAGWSISIDNPDQCMAFFMRCGCRSHMVHVVVADEEGSITLRLLPRSPMISIALTKGITAADRPQRVWPEPPGLQAWRWPEQDAQATVMNSLNYAAAKHAKISVTRGGRISATVQGHCHAACSCHRVARWEVGQSALCLDLDMIDSACADEDSLCFSQSPGVEWTMNNRRDFIRHV